MDRALGQQRAARGETGESKEDGGREARTVLAHAVPGPVPGTGVVPPRAAEGGRRRRRLRGVITLKSF